MMWLFRNLRPRPTKSCPTQKLATDKSCDETITVRKVSGETDGDGSVDSAPYVYSEFVSVSEMASEPVDEAESSSVDISEYVSPGLASTAVGAEPILAENENPIICSEEEGEILVCSESHLRPSKNV